MKLRSRRGRFVHLILGGSALALGSFAMRAADADVRPGAATTNAIAPSTSTSLRGAALLRVLGPRAAKLLAPSSGRPGALVKLPSGTTAASLGLTDAAPGFARLRGTPADLLQFADAHPDLPFEIGPTLHPLMDRAGIWTRAVEARSTRHVDGTGVLVGVADTGLDVTHPDVRDANGNTRVVWLLDLSLPPLGKYPDLEKQFGVLDGDGNVVTGAVFDAAMINDGLKNSTGTLPTDQSGHGTHVTSIATGSGQKYTGIAPGAGIVFVRVTRDSSESIENDDLIRAAGFLFNRGDAEKKAIAVNFSLGTDFGPHDGTMAFETALAAYVGPNNPGHALVVAAGNSGSIAETPIHQSVHVTSDATSEVTLVSPSGASDGTVQIWATFQQGTNMQVGLEGPSGEWVPLVSPGQMFGSNGDGYTAGVVNGSSVDMSPVPAGSNGAVIVWTGKWPAGTYNVTLRGVDGSSGIVDLYMETGGDVSAGAAGAFGFASGVREGTINLPATEPSIIGVGCTVNRPTWTSITGATSSLHVPVLDAAGTSFSGTTRGLADGEICWFSSAGPTETGVPKPEIAAPGGLVVAALSAQADPGGTESIFTTPDCPVTTPGQPADPRCLQVDATHAVAVGTSMSSPMVAGAAALLFQQDPTITQDKLVTLLQSGAHHFRGADPFDDQGGPGELDVDGAFDALALIAADNAAAAVAAANDGGVEAGVDGGAAAGASATLPSAGASWLTLSRNFAPFDGSAPVDVIVELRTAGGAGRADLFSASRLAAYAAVDGQMIAAPKLSRVAPGLWSFAVTVPAGHGGGSLTLGVTFDGADIAQPKTIPISSDIWTAYDPVQAHGGCAVSPSEQNDPRGAVALAFGILVVGGALRRRQRSPIIRPRA